MLEQKILKTIKKYELIKNGDNIVVGVSGGPDSMALLNALINIRKNSNLKFDITVAHINHMIRIEAEEETKYVQNFCSKNNIRGSGTSGLKGIEPIRENKYIRALIECTRAEIEEYCEKQNLAPKIDKSNMENIYTRNKVRNLLIPYIKENFNPNIITSLNRLSSLAASENEFIQKKVEESYKEVLIKEMLGNKDLEVKKEIIIDLKKFNKLDLVIKNRLMLYTISRVLGASKNIEKVHIEDLVKLCSNNIGNKYLTPNKNIKVMVNNGKVYFEQL